MVLFFEQNSLSSFGTQIPSAQMVFIKAMASLITVVPSVAACIFA